MQKKSQRTLTQVGGVPAELADRYVYIRGQKGKPGR